ncbi:hypothetical protein BpHYR1_014292 [Brachionus plicatilis]|uniref:Uncharacterized protein n=1 Tax=Brachionus plicatilis TaxID=10195 RepID=A0A3M7R5N6_BRAPC|nr:hypothetical protein BpHYR1_014292 [Brachionus plicatilis]
MNMFALKPCLEAMNATISGEQFHSRWTKEGNEPFISKGYNLNSLKISDRNGRSLMYSDFLVDHPSSPFFELSDHEWSQAIIKYPNLLEPDVIFNEENSCTASIQPGKEGYFNNETILSQFELLVDNATTHTTLTVKLDNFRLKPGGYCPC